MAEPQFHWVSRNKLVWRSKYRLSIDKQEQISDGSSTYTIESCELYQDSAGERIKAVYVRRSLTFVRNIFSCPLLSDSHRFSSLGLIHRHPDLVDEIDEEPSALSQLFNCGCVGWRLMTMKLGCHHHKHNWVTIGNRNRWRQFTFFTWDGHVW